MSSIHHLAVRVADLERSTAFYENVFGGRVAFSMSLDSEFVEHILLTPRGVAALLNWMSFENNDSLELWQFTPEQPKAESSVLDRMHFGFWVPDVDATVARVAEWGGLARIGARPWADRYRVTFVEDPDGHVIELLDATVEETIGVVLAGGGPPQEA